MKKKILVVDDEVKLCEMFKKNLEKTGKYEVEFETKGAQAFEKVRAYKPDLVILDIMLPDKRGSNIAVEIQTDPEFGKTPLLYVTALAKKGSEKLFLGIVDGKPFHAEPVLSKPVSTKDLINSIEKLLNPPPPFSGETTEGEVLGG
ncbi:MAG TPA: response regulator [Candidatus Omnitrophota bacterium]|nr:response regulator [Candidatus Omnitrophota bacterium]